MTVAARGRRGAKAVPRISKRNKRRIAICLCAALIAVAAALVVLYLSQKYCLLCFLA